MKRVFRFLIGALIIGLIATIVLIAVGVLTNVISWETQGEDNVRIQVDLEGVRGVGDTSLEKETSSGTKPGEKMGILAVFSLVFFGLIILLLVRVVGPTETAIVVRLGDPVRVIRSGPHLLFPRGIDILVRYPTKQYNFVFPEREVITKKGVYAGENYAAAVLKVDAVLYFFWPEDSSLIKAFRAAPPPDLASVLMDFFEESVVGTMREIAGEMTWREVVENRRTIAISVTNRLLSESESPFHQAGISHLNFLIKEITLPEVLQRTITVPQTEELRRRGVAEQAEAERIFTEKQGEAYGNVFQTRGLIPTFLTFFASRKTPPQN